MTRRRRLVLLAAAGALVGALVAIGVVLATDDGARPVAREPAAGGAAEPAAPGGPASEPAAPRGDRGEPLELSGTDPVTGEAVSLAAFAGKPVVLNFWASWCAPCREELPALIEFQERHPEAAVVGVNFQDDPAGARALQEEIGFEFPSIADPQGEIGARLGIQGMPTTYFLDSEHRVVAALAGGTDLAGFEEGLRLATEEP